MTRNLLPFPWDSGEISIIFFPQRGWLQKSEASRNAISSTWSILIHSVWRGFKMQPNVWQNLCCVSRRVVRRCAGKPAVWLHRAQDRASLQQAWDTYMTTCVQRINPLFPLVWKPDSWRRSRQLVFRLLPINWQNLLGKSIGEIYWVEWFSSQGYEAFYFVFITW